MEKLAEILQDLTLLCDKADLYYPTWDSRPKFLRELTENLKAATQEQDQITQLKRIKGFLTGGQGSFHDIVLSPYEADREISNLINKVYMPIHNLLAEYYNNHASQDETEAAQPVKNTLLPNVKLLYSSNKEVLMGESKTPENKAEVQANINNQYNRDKLPAVFAGFAVITGSMLIVICLWLIVKEFLAVATVGNFTTIIEAVIFVVLSGVTVIVGALFFYAGYYNLRLALSRDPVQVLYHRLIRHGKVAIGDVISISKVNEEYLIHYSFVARGLLGKRVRFSDEYVTSQPPTLKALEIIAVFHTNHVSIIL